MLSALSKSNLEALSARGVHLVRPTITVGSIFEPPCDFDAYVQSGEIKVGAFSFCQGGRINDVNIGRYCSIAPDVAIGMAEHPIDWMSTSPLQYSVAVRNRWAKFGGHAGPFPIKRKIRPLKRTNIGNDVWIGYRAIIRAGVTIGTGAIVGAGSIVLKDVPPYAIVVGVPARVVRYRFDEITVRRLLRSEWWDYSIANFDIDFGASGAWLNDIEKIIDRAVKYRPDVAVIRSNEPAVSWETA